MNAWLLETANRKRTIERDKSKLRKSLEIFRTKIVETCSKLSLRSQYFTLSMFVSSLRFMIWSLTFAGLPKAGTISKFHNYLKGSSRKRFYIKTIQKSIQMTAKSYSRQIIATTMNGRSLQSAIKQERQTTKIESRKDLEKLLMKIVWTCSKLNLRS